MDKSNFKQKIPNILTIFRIVLAPIVIILLLVNFGPLVYQISFVNTTISISLNHLLASILFVISAFTDFLDGFLARRWKCVSNFGKFWDPIADKILVNSTLFILAFKSCVPIWIPIIILIRDIIMDGIRMDATKNKIIIPANIWGKIKTFLMLISIIANLFFGAMKQHSDLWWYWAVQNLLNYLSLILCVISLIIYSLEYRKKVKELKDNETKNIPTKINN